MLGKRKKETVVEKDQYIKINNYDRNKQIKLSENISLLLEAPFMLVSPKILAILDQFNVSYQVTDGSINLDEYMKLNFQNKLAKSTLIKLIADNNLVEFEFEFDEIKSISDLMVIIGYDKDDELTISIEEDCNPQYPILTIYSKNLDQVSSMGDINTGTWKKFIIEQNSSVTKYEYYSNKTIQIKEQNNIIKSEDGLSSIELKYRKHCDQELKLEFSNDTNSLCLSFKSLPYNEQLTSHENINVLYNSISPVINYLKTIPAECNLSKKEHLFNLLNELMNTELISSLASIDYDGHQNDFYIGFDQEESINIVSSISYKGTRVHRYGYTCKSKGLEISRKEGKDTEVYHSNLSDEERIRIKEESLKRIEQTEIFKTELNNLILDKKQLTRVR